MRPHQRQRGSLLIVAVVMIVVIGFLGSAITYLAVSQVNSDISLARAAKALFIAESGLERGLRRWWLNPTTYAGEGPVVFGDGNFTIAVSNTDALGTPLAANQSRITSTATVAIQGGNTIRVNEAIAQIDPTGINEPFPNITAWPTAGPTGDTFNRACPPGVDNVTAPANTGTAGYDPTDNAPGSTGGAFRAEVDGNVADGRLTGYREHAFAAPFIGGENLVLSLWFSKIRTGGQADNMMMAVDLVARDNTVYRLWSDCQVGSMGWSSATVNWLVPAGKSITRIRLAYDVKNENKAKNNKVIAILFDEVNITGPSATAVSMVKWREILP